MADTRMSHEEREAFLADLHVSVEGTVTAVRLCDDGETRAMARRYLGERLGDAYTDANAGNESVRVSVRPDRWLTVDYAKSDLGG